MRIGMKRFTLSLVLVAILLLWSCSAYLFNRSGDTVLALYWRIHLWLPVQSHRNYGLECLLSTLMFLGLSTWLPIVYFYWLAWECIKRWSFQWLLFGSLPSFSRATLFGIPCLRLGSAAIFPVCIPHLRIGLWDRFSWSGCESKKLLSRRLTNYLTWAIDALKLFFKAFTVCLS